MSFSIENVNVILIYIFFVMMFLSIILFFWAIYKMVKTQDKKYAWGMLPFYLLMVGMLFF